MLGQRQLQSPMSRSLQFAILPALSGSKHAALRVIRFALLAALLACAGSLVRAQAQDQAPQQPAAQPASQNTAQDAPAAALPNDPALAPSSAMPEAPAGGLNSAAPAFGQSQAQDQAQPTNTARGSRGRFRQTSGTGGDSYQPPAGFGDSNSIDGSSMGLTPAAGFAPGTAPGRQFSGGFSPFSGTSFGGAGFGGRSGNAAPLFPAGDGPMRGALNPFGPAPAALPSLNQLLRGSFAMPLSSSSSAFRFSYQDALRPGGSLSDLDRPSGSVMFTSSDLGNGVFFSAGTGYGTRSTPGAPPTTFGINTPGAKHSSSAVNLKLSF
jgi:hypothetical protein